MSKTILREFGDDPTGVPAPVGFCIDNSGSIATSAHSIRKTSLKLLDFVAQATTSPPEMTLVTFTDNFGKKASESDPKAHTETIGTTSDKNKFKSWLGKIKFTGGADNTKWSFERAAFGLRQCMLKMKGGKNGAGHGVIFLVTDTGSKNRDQKDIIMRMKQNFEMEIFIIFAPMYKPSKVPSKMDKEAHDALKWYEDVSTPLKPYNVKDIDPKVFKKEIVDHYSTKFTWFFVEHRGRYLEPWKDPNDRSGKKDELRLNKKTDAELKNIKGSMSILWRFDKLHNVLINKNGYHCMVDSNSKRNGAKVKSKKQPIKTIKKPNQKSIAKKTVSKNLIAVDPAFVPDLNWTAALDIDYKTMEDIHNITIWKGGDTALNFKYYTLAKN